MPLLIILGIVVLMVVAITAVLWAEQRDKEQRKANNLPPKKYHDITDYDVTTVQSIRYK